MEILVNGTPWKLREGAKVSDLLSQYGTNADNVIIRVNKKLVRKTSRILKDGDEVTIKDK